MSIFMKYGNIVGASSDAGHEGWLDIVDCSFGVKRRITSNSSTQNDRESSNAEVTDLVITRRVDAATPSLFLESCCGTGQTAVLHLSKAGSGQGAEVFVEYTLNNALISSYAVEARAQDVSRPTEKIVISFVGLDVRYTPYDQDGKAMAPVSVGYDIATNVRR